jgi:uncharacterized heparinase superfamily protein
MPSTHEAVRTPYPGIARIARVLRKPPHVVLHRVLTEFNTRIDRYRAPWREHGFDAEALFAATESADIHQLWRRIGDRVHAIPIRPVSARAYDRACPGDHLRIFAAAENALAHRVDLLGSGPVALGSPIDWHTDFKTGTSWPVDFMRDIDYANLGQPSDVKVPWELSRVQWLVPAGQAYLLSNDERYAEAVRDVLDDWIAANPYAHGVNWACTMEVALRIVTWTWLFHVFSRSRAWADEAFQLRFLRTLFLHGEFTERYIERSDINGNHFTADAVGMVFAGLFFGRGEQAVRWANEGWQFLCDELPRQVFPDGVNFEASVAYHRLVTELFFLAARYREACGFEVADAYRDRLVAMARFAKAYSRPDGTTPLVGDADDARVLPFGGQPIGDHRYLAGLIGVHWHVDDLIEAFDGPRAEVFWTLGPRAAASLPAAPAECDGGSAAFCDAGIFVMRNARDHVVIDCGPVGTAGRGGHGHNDCLSFEAALDGVQLVSDCGAYVYTASVDERNRFRSTASHNTPQIGGHEINRFIQWDHLWTLHDDARPEVVRWETSAERDLFVGSHSGYTRIEHDLRPIRSIVLDHARHRLTITDDIEGDQSHPVTIPFHLAVGVEASSDGEAAMRLTAGARQFRLTWSSSAEWQVAIEPARISPSYGVAVPSTRLVWRVTGPLPVTLIVEIEPVAMEVR